MGSLTPSVFPPLPTPSQVVVGSSMRDFYSFGSLRVNPLADSPSNLMEKWSTILLKNKSVLSKASMKFIPNFEVDNERVVAVSSLDFEAKVKQCENLVVGVFVVKRLAYFFVKSVIERVWKTKGSFNLTLHGESTFTFDFENDEVRSTALEHGVLFISSRLFIVQPWHPDLESEIAEINSIPIWMNLRKVSLHFWQTCYELSRIVSYLGRPIMMDTQTLNRTTMSYARVYIEIDVMCDFPSTILVVVDGKKGFNVDVGYSCNPQDICIVMYLAIPTLIV